MNHDEAVSTLASERYLLDEMSARERDEFEAHFFDCVTCADDVRLGSTMREGAGSFFARRQTARVAPTPIRRFPVMRGWPAAVLPLAAAALLAIAVGYQTLVVEPGLRAGNVPAVVPAVVLRPATRGAAATVTRGEAGAPAVVAIDAAFDEGTGAVSYEITGTGGKTVASGRAPRPAAGAPLYLVLPARTPPGEYLLRLTSNPSDTDTVDYRFVVK